jgi:integrase/recombinase XerC
VKVATAFCTFLGDRTAPTRRDVEAFLARPLRNGALPSIATRNQALAAVRAFSLYAVDEGVLLTNPTHRVTALREPRRGKVVFFRSEIHRFFHVIEATSLPAFRSRDRVVLALLFTIGLRGSELVGLDVDQVDFTSGTLLQIYGKGGTIHDLPLETKTLSLLRAWIRDREPMVEPGEAALFVSDRGTRLSLRTLERTFKRLLLATGTKKPGTPHTARHSTATNLLVFGNDIAVAGGVLRHSDLNTTRGYVHLVDTQRRRAVGTLSVVIPEDVLPVEESAAERQMSFEFQDFSETLSRVAPANDVVSLDDQCGLDDFAA